ncbi:hypothetical protein [Kribbella italica]|uniref:Uncharacterized protein n=1 Tax=Kribbella italica TaxID=1540520 RepID=A0A7W9MTU4_9ACTN|nr:hypothetical protein [Kribbella italica]MBB5835562.1 hypothetical protein [Kribbella italica]
MRTEHDLRDAFDHLATSAPHPDDILANLPSTSRRPVRRGRTPMVVGVVLATAAAAVAIPLVGQARQSAPPVAAEPPATNPWFTGITVDLLPGMRYSTQGITSTGDHSVLIDTGRPEPRCGVTRYRPGGFDVKQIPAGATPITVGQSRGFQYGSGKNPDGTLRQGAVVWSYAENSWARSECTKPTTFEFDAGQSLEIARRSVFGRAVLPSPLRLTYLPAGFRPTGVSVIRQDPHLAGVPKRFGVYAAKGAPVPGVVTADKDQGIRIEYSVTSLAAPSGTTYQVVHSRPELVVTGNGFKLVISVPATLADGRAELDKIAANLDRAPVPTDPRTWFDAATALP